MFIRTFNRDKGRPTYAERDESGLLSPARIGAQRWGDSTQISTPFHPALAGTRKTRPERPLSVTAIVAAVTQAVFQWPAKAPAWQFQD